MPGCDHTLTEFMMRRDGVEYLRCLDCGHVFESEDLDPPPPADDREADQRSSESLDARKP